MKRMNICDPELIKALRRMAPETGSLLCPGCGYEHGCSIHGCAILKAAVDRLAELTALPTNPPLTPEELREMDGEPVWIAEEHSGEYALIWCVYDICIWITTRYDADAQMMFADYGKTWLAYRRKPEEVTT